MKNRQLQALLEYRIQQAKETLREADILEAQEAYRGALNRAYYAMFYAAVALLATKGLGTSKHSGVLSIFDREFVKTGHMSKDQSKRLHMAFECRQQHDYGEFMPVHAKLAKNIIADAKTFVEQITVYLQKKKFLDDADERSLNT